MRRCLFAILTAVLSVATATADDAHSPKALLKSMCDAMNSSTYHGTFVHMNGKTVESMEIFRRKDKSGEIERLFSLNGEAREIIRDGDTLKCILPKSKHVIFDKARPGSQLPLAFPQDIENIENYYVLEHKGDERIAGHICKNVRLTPKDMYRYGHQLCIALPSHLLVKSMLLDERGSPLEQMMFTQLETSDTLPDTVFEPQLDTHQYQVQQVQRGAAQKSSKVMPMLQWQLSNIPKGFYIVSHDRKEMSPHFKEHIVLSDGMATVSVFVESWKKGEKTLVGASKMSAVNAFGRVLKGNKVVAVGEVPLATVKLLAQGVQQQ